ncbi:IS3 family transposase [Hymenobacter actinosclerus]|uniref:Transposase InsO and inactivated derivatives n=4 Tax=Hymenobacter TaxID=89966 RepID=A0A1I0AD44_9BACT|nr:IS3 family transposase [Hymenobacter actinosclerus]SES92066.1 Transposase InsO and inactivated derivatives [Hymenobacter actinosclerus]
MLKSHPSIAIRSVEGVLGFSRQAYYQYWQRQAGHVNQEAVVVNLVRAIREDHPRMGTRKLYERLQDELTRQHLKMGRDALFELLAAHGLLVRRRRRRVQTTFSRHRFRKYPNLISALLIERPNQVWVADITYWFTAYGCLYISLVTDAYSRRIMGYEVAPTLQAVHCRTALQRALDQLAGKEGKPLIHHSDRGVQYCSAEYIGLLNAHQVQVSMTQQGDPLENAIAERINGILKNEYLAHQRVYSLAQAQTVLQQAVHLYNYQRPHLSCDMLVPDQAHQKEGKLKRRWRNYYRQQVVDDSVVNEKTD